MKKSVLPLFTSMALLASACSVSISSTSGAASSQGHSDTSLSSSSEQTSSLEISSSNADFTGVYFDDVTATYDGETHILGEVRGAPEGTLITYTGRNSFRDVGTYKATALLSKSGYNDKTLTATLTITKADFENITFEDAVFDYDGKPHSIYVQGAPSFASISYANNGKTSVGTYTVTATITSPNYNTLKKSATLRILGKTIEGVKLSDQTLTYDGEKHSLEVEGELPSGVSVSYTNNGKVDSGTYEVTANLTGAGYEPLELKAKLTITPAALDKPGYFRDQCVLYDGKSHALTVTSAPEAATISYRCTNASGTNSFIEAGQYDIEATVKTDKNHASILSATLFIMDAPNVGVDSSKTALTIDENLTWDALHEALNKDNLTCDYFSGSYDVDAIDDPRPSDLLTYEGTTHDFRTHFVTDGKQAYSQSYSTYSDPYYAYDFYVEAGEDIFHASFQEDGSDTDYEKFPKAAFSETICKPQAANAFVALTKGESGEFLLGTDRDDYYKDTGYPFIQDDKFIVLMEHPRSLSSGQYRYFYEVYEFYNIGNSSVKYADTIVPSTTIMEDRCAIGDYRLNGAKYRYAAYGSYSNMKHYYSVELYVSYATKVFLKPGTYTILPYIYEEPVRAIVHYSYYNQYYNYDQSGYVFNLYIDEEGDYQGEYEELGSLSRLDLRDFLSDDGEVRYYDQWHE